MSKERHIRVGNWYFGMGKVEAQSKSAIVIRFYSNLIQSITDKIIRHYAESDNLTLKMTDDDGNKKVLRFTDWQIDGNAIMFLK